MKTMVCVDHLGYSGFNYEAFVSINSVVADLEEVSIATVDVTNKFIDIKTAVYNLTEMHSFSDGVLMASSLRNAKRVLACANNAKKVLYLYDLDWTSSIMKYDEIHSVLSDKRLRIICRSKSHQDALKRSFGIDAVILKKFDLREIWNLLE